jgi:hypothetical protein
MDASDIDAGLRELREQIMGVAQTWLASQVLTLQVSEQHGDDGALRSIQLDRGLATMTRAGRNRRSWIL